ncbi:MAG TPA: hypothetical protein VN700_02795 [Vicinamibacterales bacterium]|nr:hypothetical protein [Vicinamibacterales bacterium]
MARHPRQGLTLTVLVALALIAPATAQSVKSPSEMDGDELFAAWRATGASVLTAAFPDSTRFEKFRNDFRDRTLKRWVEKSPGAATWKPNPLKAMFMLDIAVVAQPRHRYWADFLHLGLDYFRERLDTVGADESMDAFEILWSKTAISFASGRRQPEVVEALVKLLLRRMAPVPAPPPTRRGAVVVKKLVDPWIVLMQGYAQEAYVHLSREHLEDHSPAAITAYDRAAQFEETRAEATIRKAWLQLESRRAADALTTIETFDDAWTNEAVLLYWARLIRGKALAAVGEADAATRAYGAALELVPSAQSPRVGILSIEAGRGRADVAEAIAKDIRTAPDPVHDPWWIYPHGDLRFFLQRERTLRAMASQ